MKLWIVNTDEYGWDVYYSVVVSAPDKDRAIAIAETKLAGTKDKYKIEYIGEGLATTESIIHESYNAG
jgi:hypothetical protein